MPEKSKDHKKPELQTHVKKEKQESRRLLEQIAEKHDDKALLPEENNIREILESLDKVSFVSSKISSSKKKKPKKAEVSSLHKKDKKKSDAVGLKPLDNFYFQEPQPQLDYSSLFSYLGNLKKETETFYSSREKDGSALKEGEDISYRTIERIMRTEKMDNILGTKHTNLYTNWQTVETWGYLNKLSMFFAMSTGKYELL